MSLLTSFRSSSDEGAVAVRSFSGGSGTNDEFRLVKWHFLAHSNTAPVGGKHPRVILITSANEGEGKSYVSHHLAANFALDPNVQLTLVDADFDNPALGSSSWMGGSSSGPGLLDYLEDHTTDHSRILMSTGLPNVKVILSGSRRDNAPELLASGRVEHLMSAVAANAHACVILDAGPVLSGGAAVLARSAGQIGFVLAANRTRRSDINQSLATLDRIAGPIDENSVGLIFN